MIYPSDAPPCRLAYGQPATLNLANFSHSHTPITIMDPHCAPERASGARDSQIGCKNSSSALLKYAVFQKLICSLRTPKQILHEPVLMIMKNTILFIMLIVLVRNYWFAMDCQSTPRPTGFFHTSISAVFREVRSSKSKSVFSGPEKR